MASELGGNKNVVIGAAVGPSLGTVFNTIENRLKHLGAQGDATQALKASVKEAMDLQGALEGVEDKGSPSAIKLQARFDKVRDDLKAQKVDVNRLGDAYTSLGRVMEGIEQQKKGLALIAEGKASVAQSKAVFSTVMKSVNSAVSFDTKVGEAMGPTRLEGEDLARKKDDVRATATKVSRETGMSSADVLGLIGALRKQGMELDSALAYVASAARFSAREGVGTQETAGLVAALSRFSPGSADGGGMEQVLAGYAAQARDSGLGMAGTVQVLTRLLPAMSNPDTRSTADLLHLGGMVQVHVPSASGSDGGEKALARWLEGKAPIEAATGGGEPTLAIDSRAARARYAEFDSKAADSKLPAKDDESARQTPAQKIQSASNALDDLSRDFGTILLPAAGTLAGMLTTVVQGLNDWMNGNKQVVQGITGLVLGISALGAVVGTAKIAKGALDVGLGLFKQGTGAAQGKGKPGLLGSLLRLGGGNASAGGVGQGSGGGRPVDVFVVNLGGLVRGPFGTAGPAAAGRDKGAGKAPGKAPDNAPDKGAGKAPGNAADKVAGTAPVGQVEGSPKAAQDVDRKAQPPKEAHPEPSGGQPAEAASRGVAPKSAIQPGSNPGGSVPGMGFASHAAPARSFSLSPKALLKRIPGANWVDAALTGWDLYQSASDPDAKAEGLAAVAGNLGGSWAGGAAGAAIGTMILPGVGTVVGGLIGAALGGMAGEEVGGQVGKAVVQATSQPTSQAAKEAPSQASGVETAVEVVRALSSVKYAGREPGDVARDIAAEYLASATQSARQPSAEAVATATPSPQNFAVSPNISITVQGSIANAAELVGVLQPQIQKMFNDLAVRANRGRQFWDEPAVTQIA